jgi:conjugal transfer pilus assembly protein TrbC
MKLSNCTFLAAAFAVAMATASAQKPAVPPAGNVVITEQDMERATRANRMPSDEELSRVPIPGPVNVDALPAPKVQKPLDLEAIAKGYQAAIAEQSSPDMPSRQGPVLLVFVSFTMPRPTLDRLVDQASRAHAVLVVRGLIDGSFMKTVQASRDLIGQRKVAMKIDPQAFRRFSVQRAPTFVLVQDGAQLQPCAEGVCPTASAFVSVAGDVSVRYALEHMVDRAPGFRKDAQPYLNRVKS